VDESKLAPEKGHRRGGVGQSLTFEPGRGEDWQVEGCPQKLNFFHPRLENRYMNKNSRTSEHESVEEIRVLISDVTPMYSELLVRALKKERGFDVARVPLQEVVTAVTNYGSSVVVVGTRLHEKPHGGFDLTQALCASHPEAQVVILLESDESEFIIEAFRSGAKGVLSPGESIDNLSKCIRVVHTGQVWASSRQLRHVLEALRDTLPSRLISLSGKSLLSKREQDVVRFMTRGLTNSEIAKQLNLSVHTVKNYVFTIFDKLGVSNRIEVVLYATSQRPNGYPRIGSSDAAT